MRLWDAAVHGEAVLGVASEQGAQHVADTLPKVARHPAVSEQAELGTEHAVRNAVHAAVEGSKQSRDIDLQKQYAACVLAGVANLT